MKQNGLNTKWQNLLWKAALQGDAEKYQALLDQVIKSPV